MGGDIKDTNALGSSMRTNSLTENVKGDLQDSTSRPVSTNVLPKGKLTAAREEPDDNNSDDGNMLNQLDNMDIDFDKKGGDQDEENDKLFGLGNSNEHYNRVTRNF